MLFDKNVRKICAFCRHGQDFDDDVVLCKKCGPVSSEHHCRKFVYDPIRRDPPRPLILRKPSSEDAFKL